MGGGGPSTVTQTNTTKLSPQQQQLFDQMFPYAQQYAKNPIQMFQGTGIAPFTPAQLQAQETALGAAGTGGQLASQAASTQSQLLDPGFMLNPNQYLQPAMDAVSRTTTQNLMENILPKIRGGSTSSGGQYSGGATRQGIAEGQAIGRTSAEISDALAKLVLQNYQTGLQGLNTAVGQTPQLQQMQLFPAQVMSAVGTQQQQMNQQQLNEMIQQFYTQQDLPLLQAQQLTALLSGMPGATGVSTVQGAMPKTNPFMQAIGLGASLLGGGFGAPFGMLGGK